MHGEAKPVVNLEQIGAKAADQAASAPNHQADEAREMATAKSTKAPAFQFYPRDFLTSSKVMAMSLAQVGAYTKLLCLCWLDGSIPSDPKALAKLVGITPKQMAGMWPEIEPCFRRKPDGRLVSERLDRERKVQAEYRRRQADAANKRWDKLGNATALAPHDGGNALLPLPQSSSSSPLTGTARPLVAKRRMDAAFEGPRVWVPQRTHTNFLALRHGDEASLFAFYERVSHEWGPGGPKADAETGASMFKFWDARYDEEWPAPIESKPRWARPEGA